MYVYFVLKACARRTLASLRLSKTSRLYMRVYLVLKACAQIDLESCMVFCKPKTPDFLEMRD